EDSEEEHADYPADGGDGDDELSDDDTDDDDADDDEEPFGGVTERAFSSFSNLFRPSAKTRKLFG
ncbi:hypothetical protein Tco_0550024, partial [Tanacetum coccineum]